MTTAFTSRRQAIKAVRAATGDTLDECTRRVNQLPRKQSGKREKVSTVQVRRLIAEMSRPPEMPTTKITMRPLSAKHLLAAKEARIHHSG